MDISLLFKVRVKEILHRLTGRETVIEKAKRNFLRYYKDTEDSEIAEMRRYIRSTGWFGMINKELKHNWSNFCPVVDKDDERGLFYVEDEGRRIYWSRKYDKNDVAAQYRALKVEQDEYSPHRYLTDDDIDYIKKLREDGKKVICVECGAMEGMFTLQIIDYLDKAYLFECESDWKEAEEATFSDYGSKVNIICKYVSDVSKDNMIKIDDMYADMGSCDTENTLFIVKMDIEGAEMQALEGMRRMLSEAKWAMLFVCAYHRQNDEKEIREYFKEGYCIEHTDGYFCYYVDPMYDKPYVRRCVMKIRKDLALGKE